MKNAMTVTAALLMLTAAMPAADAIYLEPELGAELDKEFCEKYVLLQDCRRPQYPCRADDCASTVKEVREMLASFECEEDGSCHQVPTPGREVLDRLTAPLLDFILNLTLDGKAGDDNGQSRSQCDTTSGVCALAMANLQAEKVDNAPNLGVAATAGHGSSQNPVYGGRAVFTTTLGSDACSFRPGEGCGEYYSDVHDLAGGNCKYKVVTAYTTATATGPGSDIITNELGLLVASAFASDSTC